MNYEEQYINNLKYILQDGTRELNQRTGIATYRVPSTQIIVDLSYEFPILRSKKVNWKTAADEVLWMFQKHSNVTAELNSHIWDSWTGEDGTIGKSYGYQVGQKTRGFTNQVEYILETLKADSSNRQCVIDLWNVSELEEMNLVPCVYSSVWNIIDNKLNCMVVQRSADYPVGVPFDTLEYGILMHMIARHLDVELGILTHVMADSHIYENQLTGAQKQIKQYEELKTLKNPSPIFSIDDKASKNFWEINLDDFNLNDYSPMPPIKFDVAV